MGTVDVRSVLATLLEIVDGSTSYFVSGSLSLLPLVPEYRKPRHDVDVAVSVGLFEARRSAFEAAGELEVLRLAELAVADRSPITRVFSPKSKFVHIHTPAGLIDLSQYHMTEGFLEVFLGAGLSLRVPASVMSRVQVVNWQGLSYRAGAPELALLPKLQWYQTWKSSGNPLVPGDEKHLLDLRHTLGLVDWSFATDLLSAAHLAWHGRRLPARLERALNPFNRLDLARLRSELSSRHAEHHVR